MTQKEFIIDAVKEHGDRMLELFRLHDLAVIGQKIQDESTEAIYNAVLQENEFYVAPENEGIKPATIGRRITSNDWSFLLSKEDFDRLYSLAHPKLVKANIIDEDGHYRENWLEMKVKAHQACLRFAVNHFIPDGLGLNERLNYVQGTRLLDLVRKMVGAPAQP